MAFIPDDPATIESATVASLGNRFTGKDTSPESFIGKMARAIAQALWSYEKKLQRISLDTVPQSKTTFERLSELATALGLSNGAGGFGPLQATDATGLQGTASGTPTTTIPSGSKLIAPDGTTEFQTTADFTIGGGGTVTITFNAITPGTSGNLQLPSTLTFISPGSGISATVVLSVGTNNGTDLEAPAALLARILNRLQDPPMGGTQNDWDVWAKTQGENPDALPLVTSIVRSYGYARRNGTGTVDEVVVYAPDAAGIGTSRQVSAGDLTTIGTYVDSVRPVTVEGRRILTPYMPGPNALTIRTRIIPYPAGAFDWDDTASTLTVASTAAGPPHTITLSGAAPASFQSAVTAGLNPRLQIPSTTGNPINALVRATSYNVGAFIVTLEDPLPAGFIMPNNGDAVYAGGNAVSPIATAQLAYVNSLGPSRSGGYADPNDAWNDAVETEQLGRAALDAVDATGSPLAKNIVKSSSIPQVTIAVGVGAPAASDYQTADDGTNPPELAYASHVLVTA